MKIPSSVVWCEWCWNKKVTEAGNGADALKLAQHDGIQAVILDCLGHTSDGLNTVKYLRGDQRTMGIPVIAMVGLGQHGSELGLWVNSILVKPFRPAQLLLKVQTVIPARANTVFPKLQTSWVVDAI